MLRRPAETLLAVRVPAAVDPLPIELRLRHAGGSRLQQRKQMLASHSVTQRQPGSMKPYTQSSAIRTTLHMGRSAPPSVSAASPQRSSQHHYSNL